MFKNLTQLGNCPTQNIVARSPAKAPSVQRLSFLLLPQCSANGYRGHQCHSGKCCFGPTRVVSRLNTGNPGYPSLCSLCSLPVDSGGQTGFGHAGQTLHSPKLSLYPPVDASSQGVGRPCHMESLWHRPLIRESLCPFTLQSVTNLCQLTTCSPGSPGMDPEIHIRQGDVVHLTRSSPEGNGTASLSSVLHHFVFCP